MLILKMQKKLCLFCVCFLLCAMPTRAIALVIDSREIALIMESTLVDLDMSVISVRHGLNPTSQLHYISKIEDTGWQGRLFGNYGNHEVDIYYTGSVEFIGGPNSQFNIAYGSEWFLDGQLGTGSGAGIYTDPPFSFEIDLINMQVSGAVSVTYGIATLTLSGSKNLSEHTLSVRGSASIINLGVFGSLVDAGLGLEYNQLTGAYASVLDSNVAGGLLSSHTTINSGSIRRLPPGQNPPAPPKRGQNPPNFPFPPGGQNGGFVPGDPGFNNMVVSTVPEPSSLLLMAFGLLLISFVRHFRIKGKSIGAGLNLNYSAIY